jgi:hypothetical protein
MKETTIISMVVAVVVASAIIAEGGVEEADEVAAE